MTQRINGDIERVGVQVAETFQLRLDPSDGQEEEFRRNPADFMRRFLEQQGFAVNRVQFIRREDSESAESGTQGSALGEPEPMRMPDTTFHIVFPETSAWICCCS
jgi:hypothetical protein